MTVSGLLRKIEWKKGTSGIWCPVCMNFKHTGHTKDCTLTQAIAEAEKACEWRSIQSEMPRIVIDDGGGMEYSEDVEITDGNSITIASFSKYHDEWYSTSFGSEITIPKEAITHFRPITLPLLRA